MVAGHMIVTRVEDILDQFREEGIEINTAASAGGSTIAETSAANPSPVHSVACTIGAGNPQGEGVPEVRVAPQREDSSPLSSMDASQREVSSPIGQKLLLGAYNHDSSSRDRVMAEGAPISSNNSSPLLSGVQVPADTTDIPTVLGPVFRPSSTDQVLGGRESPRSNTDSTLRFYGKFDGAEEPLETSFDVEDIRQRHARSSARVFTADPLGGIPSNNSAEDVEGFDDEVDELLLAVDESVVLEDEVHATADEYQTFLMLGLGVPRPAARMETVIEEPDTMSGAERSHTGEGTTESTSLRGLLFNREERARPAGASPPVIKISPRQSATSSSSSGYDTEADRNQFQVMLDERVAKLEDNGDRCLSGLSSAKEEGEKKRSRRFRDRLYRCGAEKFLNEASTKQNEQESTSVDTGKTTQTAVRSKRRPSGCGSHAREIPIQVRGIRRTQSSQLENRSGTILSTHASNVSNHSLGSWSRSDTHCAMDPEIMQHSVDRCSRPPGFEEVWQVDEDDVWPGSKAWRMSEPIPRDDSMSDRLIKSGILEDGTQTCMNHMERPTGQRGHIWSLAISADGKYLAAGTRRGPIHVWEVSEEDEVRKLRREALFIGHTGGVMRLQWSPIKGTHVLISLAFDKTIRLWALNYDTTLSIVRCVQLPIGLWFASPEQDDRIIMCTLDGASQTLTLRPSLSSFVECQKSGKSYIPMISCEVHSSFVIGDAVTSMSVSPDGSKVAYGTQFGRIIVYSLKNGEEILSIECRNRHGKHSKGQKVTGIDWGGAKLDFIVVTTRDDRIRVVPLEDSKRTLKLKASSIKLKAYIDPSYRYIICAGDNSRVFIWSLWEAAQLRRPFRRRERFLAKLGFASRSAEEYRKLPGSNTHQEGRTAGGTADTKRTGGIKLDWIPPLPPDMDKRPTALPIASFDVPGVGALTSMLVTSSPANPNHVRLLCGTASGSVQVYTCVLSEY